MFTLLIIILVFIILYFIIPFIIKKLIRKLFFKHTFKYKGIVLTFDDGPHPIGTPKILKLLDEANVKATFFLLGKNAEKYPDIIDEIRTGGHDIEEHGYMHLHPWKSDPFRYIIDLIKSNSIIKKYMETRNTIFYRPAFGKLNFITLMYILIMKRKVIFWNIDPKDYEQKSGEDVAKFILYNIKPSSIILLHDGRINKNGSDIEITISALKIILKKLNTGSFRFATIKEAMSKRIDQ